jgi:RND superfamily putative drug exporter
VIITKALGVGIAVAVILDATMIRILMVPAAMRLLGDWCWWAPAWLERRLPHIGE